MAVVSATPKSGAWERAPGLRLPKSEHVRSCWPLRKTRLLLQRHSHEALRVIVLCINMIEAALQSGVSMCEAGEVNVLPSKIKRTEIKNETNATYDLHTFSAR